jgi:soluble lytic murein transglycosylase-like protein
MWTENFCDIQNNRKAQSDAYGISRPIALATAAQESNFDVTTKGSSGEVGLFQIMPSFDGKQLRGRTGTLQG